VSLVQITPHQPAQLVSSSMGVTPTDAQWGGSIVVIAQISNTAYGNAPATRAQVVLTPAGVAPGGSADVTIGSIAVPPIPAWSLVKERQENRALKRNLEELTRKLAEHEEKWNRASERLRQIQERAAFDSVAAARPAADPEPEVDAVMTVVPGS
jgi:hypothetical protein